MSLIVTRLGPNRNLIFKLSATLPLNILADFNFITITQHHYHVIRSTWGELSLKINWEFWDNQDYHWDF